MRNDERRAEPASSIIVHHSSFIILRSECRDSSKSACRTSLRIVIEVMPDVRSAACGFLVRTGSRDEEPDLAGVSHFLEHMCFKGTAKRTWREINIDFDEMGSHYNAFTAKDAPSTTGGFVRRHRAPARTPRDMMRSAILPASSTWRRT